MKSVVARSDLRLPSYDCQQARRNFEGAMAVSTSTARDLDARRSAMQAVCNFTPPGRNINTLNNLGPVDLVPNHRTCKDALDMNCFRR